MPSTGNSLGGVGHGEGEDEEGGGGGGGDGSLDRQRQAMETREIRGPPTKAMSIETCHSCQYSQITLCRALEPHVTVMDESMPSNVQLCRGWRDGHSTLS
jgi:hypothetical protein